MVSQDSIAFASAVHGLDRRQAAAQELLDAVGLAPGVFGRRYPPMDAFPYYGLEQLEAAFEGLVTGSSPILNQQIPAVNHSREICG